MDLLIFDLDGTLIDSRLDLAHAVNATRAHLSLPPLDLDLVVSYVGNGAPVLMRRALGPEASEAEVASALAYFLEWYDEHKLDCTLPYPGVVTALDRLHAEGLLMAVLTNKPTAISRGILEGLGMARYFARIYGGDSFERKKPDPQGVETLLQEFQVARERALMVGDSGVDVLTARNSGIQVCGVTYGLKPESLVLDAPDMMVDRMEELADAVLANRRDRGALTS